MKTKIRYFPCECLGGKRECGFVGIINYGHGIEIFWTKDKKKKAKVGVYIEKEKSLKILKKLLNENL